MTHTQFIPISNTLNRQLHALLHQKGLMAAKPHLVSSFTRGRTESSAKMHQYEAIDLVRYLQCQPTPTATPKSPTPAQQANRMRRKLIALAHSMGWHTTHPQSGDTIADMPRIDAWCTKYGYLHKPLNAYTLTELPKLLSQFDKLYKSFLKAI